MRTRPFRQVDVFTAEALRGNPLAVVLDGEDLSDAQMQAFAAWTQLSETTFVLPPTPEGRAAGADYRVRIFTPGGELPFAGHPTLGTAHAWLHAGGQPQTADRIVQECGVGLVTLREIDGRRAFAAPALRRTVPEPEKLGAVLDALGLAPGRAGCPPSRSTNPASVGRCSGPARPAPRRRASPKPPAPRPAGLVLGSGVAKAGRQKPSGHRPISS